MTRSPGARSVTPLPTASTRPANSAPGENGNGGLCWYLPAMSSVSKKLSATALTRTSASPGPARGASTSASCSALGGPKCVQRTAFIRLIQFCCVPLRSALLITTKTADWKSAPISGGADTCAQRRAWLKLDKNRNVCYQCALARFGALPREVRMQRRRMRRLAIQQLLRLVLVLLGAAAAMAVWPVPASAQQSAQAASPTAPAKPKPKPATKPEAAPAKPTASETNPPNRPRNPVFMFISTRPAEKVTNEISLVVGYPFKAGTEATAQVGGSSFALYTQQDGAWIKNATEEAKMVDAMRGGDNAVVKGVSAKGTQSTHTFSLKGIAQALDRTAQECK